jgi:hypothetical protein
VVDSNGDGLDDLMAADGSGNLNRLLHPGVVPLIRPSLGCLQNGRSQKRDVAKLGVWWSCCLEALLISCGHFAQNHC